MRTYATVARRAPGVSMAKTSRLFSTASGEASTMAIARNALESRPIAVAAVSP
jgi:hypothetical protein